MTFEKEDLRGVNFCWISLILLPFDFSGGGSGEECRGRSRCGGSEVIVNCN